MLEFNKETYQKKTPGMSHRACVGLFFSEFGIGIRRFGIRGLEIRRNGKEAERGSNDPTVKQDMQHSTLVVGLQKSNQTVLTEKKPRR